MRRALFSLFVVLWASGAWAQSILGPVIVPVQPSDAPELNDQLPYILEREGIDQRRAEVGIFHVDQLKLRQLVNVAKRGDAAEISIARKHAGDPPIRLSVAPSGACAPADLLERAEMTLLTGRDLADPRVWYRVTIEPHPTIPDKLALYVVSVSAEGLTYILPSGVGDFLIEYKDRDVRPDVSYAPFCAVGARSGLRDGVSPMGLPNNEKGSHGTPRELRIVLAMTRGLTENHFAGDIRFALRDVIRTVFVASALYEREVGVRLCPIVPEFLIPEPSTGGETPASGPGIYSTNPQEAFKELQTLLDTKLPGGFDVAHLFTDNLGNLVDLEGACIPGKSAHGITAWGTTNDHNTRMFAHELAHQFSAGHTFNGSANYRHPSSAVEPGDGSSLLSYAGFREAFFHAQSLDEMRSHVAAYCKTDKGEGAAKPPSLKASHTDSVPRGQPFTLTATPPQTVSATLLQYRWDEMDVGRHPGQLPPVFHTHSWPQEARRDFPTVTELVAVHGKPAPVSKDVSELLFRVTLWDQTRAFAFENIPVKFNDLNPMTVKGLTCQHPARTCTIEWDPGDVASHALLRILVMTKDRDGHGWTSHEVRTNVAGRDGQAGFQLPARLGTSADATIRLEIEGRNLFAVSRRFSLAFPPDGPVY
jgi:hypothetical protein